MKPALALQCIYILLQPVHRCEPHLHRCAGSTKKVLNAILCFVGSPATATLVWADSVNRKSHPFGIGEGITAWDKRPVYITAGRVAVVRATITGRCSGS